MSKRHAFILATSTGLLVSFSAAPAEVSCPPGQILRVKKNTCEPKSANRGLFPPTQQRSHLSQTARQRATSSPTSKLTTDASPASLDVKPQTSLPPPAQVGQSGRNTEQTSAAAVFADEPLRSASGYQEPLAAVAPPPKEEASITVQRGEQESVPEARGPEHGSTATGLKVENRNALLGEKIFRLLQATNVSDTDPHPIPPAVLTLEPWLDRFLYVRRSGAQIDLLDASTREAVVKLKYQVP